MIERARAIIFAIAAINSVSYLSLFIGRYQHLRLIRKNCAVRAQQSKPPDIRGVFFHVPIPMSLAIERLTHR